MSSQRWRDAFDMHIAFACMKKCDPDKWREIREACEKKSWRKWLINEARSNIFFKMTKAIRCWP